MRITESGVGLVSCACWDQHATIGWKKSGFFMVGFTSFMLFGLFIPYIVVIARNMMPAFLPYVSQSNGTPPSNGLFSIFMDIGLFFGVFSFILLFVSANHRNTKNLKFLKIAIKVVSICTAVAWIGLLLVVKNPVGYTDVPNKFQWVVSVLVLHSLGASFVLAGLALMQYTIIAIWWYMPDTSKTETYVKMAFGFIYIVFFFMVLYPLPKYILEEFGPNPFDFESMKLVTYTLPVKHLWIRK